MILRIPDYYREFNCIGEKCRHNCCIGWGIDIDEDSRDTYMETEGEIGNRLREMIYCDEDGCYTFKMNGNRCPFLNNNNLCEIHISMGEDKLCTVCKEYPRYAEQFGDIIEKGIGLSCEEAGRIIFSDKNPVRFIDEDIEGEAEENDEVFYNMLISSREVLFEILQNRNYSVNARLCAALDYAGMIQQSINKNQFEFKNISIEIKERSDKKYTGAVLEIIDFFDSLHARNEEWHEILHHTKELLHNSEEDYIRAYRLLNIKTDERDYEKLLVYFIHRYYIKAMYDYDALAKVRLAASAYIMIRELDMAVIAVTNAFTLNDRIENSRLFSSELEHSQENLDALYDELMFNESFSAESLKNML